MRAIVTVFENEFKGKDHILRVIELLSDQINLVADAYIIFPIPGALFNVLNELKDNKIAYGTHYDTAEVNVNNGL